MVVMMHEEEAIRLSRQLRSEGYRVVSAFAEDDGTLVARVVPAHGPERSDIRFDPDRSTMRIRRQVVQLSPKEFALARALFEAGGALVRRDTLLQRIWNNPSHTTNNALGVHMHGLRRKINAACRGARICTVRGQGFFVEYRAPTTPRALADS